MSAHLDQGNRHFMAGRLEQARQLYEQALALARRKADARGEADALSNLGNCAFQAGDLAQAADLYTWARDVRQAARDRTGLGRELSNLGACCASLGQTEQAREYFEQALQIARETGDRRGEAARLSNLGNCTAELGQPEAAAGLFEQALAIERAIGDEAGLAIDQGNLANARMDQGRPDLALEPAQAGLSLARRLGMPLAAPGNTLALLHLQAGRLVEAQAAARTAEDLKDRLYGPAAALLNGLIALRLGEADNARAACERALSAAGELLRKTERNYSALDVQAVALGALAVLEARAGGDPAARLDHARRVFEAARAVNDRPGVVRHSLRLLDLLAPSAPGGLLDGLRRAAGG